MGLLGTLFIVGCIYVVLTDGAMFRTKRKKALKQLSTKAVTLELVTIAKRVEEMESNGKLKVTTVNQDILDLFEVIDELMINPNLVVEQMTELRALKLRLARLQRRIVQPEQTDKNPKL